MPGRTIRRRLLTILIGLAGVLGTGGNPYQRASADGPSSFLPWGAKKREAQARLPLDSLSPENRDRVGKVVDSVCLYRQMPSRVIACDHGLYRFLIEYPEALVNVWKVLDISKVVLTRTGDTTYEAVDGEGTRCQIEILYRDEDSVLLYATGSYNGKLYPRPLTGSCVIHLQSRYGAQPDDSPVVGCDLDAFLDIDNQGLELLARTVYPLVGRVADHNFTETVTFVQGLSKTCELKPYETQRLAAMLQDVDPLVQAAFSRLAIQVADRTRQREESIKALAELTAASVEAPRRPDVTR